MGLAAIFVDAVLVIQGVRHGKYLSHLKERRVWLFRRWKNCRRNGRLRSGCTVSVGEVLAGVTLAKRLKEEFPARALVVSQLRSPDRAGEGAMPFADGVIYFPLDWAFCARRALRQCGRRW